MLVLNNWRHYQLNKPTLEHLQHSLLMRARLSLIQSQDKLAKKRLQRRNFSFVRHPAYKELIEPEHKACTSYLNPKRKEFWRTDVSNVLKREMQVEKDRYKVSFQSPPNTTPLPMLPDFLQDPMYGMLSTSDAARLSGRGF